MDAQTDERVASTMRILNSMRLSEALRERKCHKAIFLDMSDSADIARLDELVCTTPRTSMTVMHPAFCVYSATPLAEGITLKNINDHEMVIQVWTTPTPDTIFFVICVDDSFKKCDIPDKYFAADSDLHELWGIHDDTLELIPLLKVHLDLDGKRTLYIHEGM